MQRVRRSTRHRSAYYPGELLYLLLKDRSPVTHVIRTMNRQHLLPVITQIRMLNKFQLTINYTGCANEQNSRTELENDKAVPHRTAASPGFKYPLQQVDWPEGRQVMGRIDPCQQANSCCGRDQGSKPSYM